MLVRASNVDILLAATNLLNKFYASDAVTEFFKRASHGALISPQGHLNAAPVSLTPGTNEGALYHKSRAVIVRIPKV